MRRRRNRCVFPGYRWCGARCSGPGTPINEVDACCMQHDLCLQRGENRCRCDKMFMNCLQPKIRGPYLENRHAALMYQVFRIKTRYRCR